jgi:DNA polymerase elongation subunit (family B)
LDVERRRVSNGHFKSCQSTRFIDFSQQIKIEVMTSERALLAFFVAKIHKIDPDVLVVNKI